MNTGIARKSTNTERRPAKKLSLVLASLALAFGLLASTAPSAEAASYGWVYLSFPSWAGNCPNGGSPKGVYAAVDNLWSTPARGDFGDDIVYAKVRLRANSTVTGKTYCERSWYRGGSYWGPASQQVIKATRSNQTWWVGPFGTWSN